MSSWGRRYAGSERASGASTGSYGWRPSRTARWSAAGLASSNTRAAAFYRRIGFVPTGAEVAYPPNPVYTEHELEYRARP